MAGGPWPNVKAEHMKNVGFVEGANNANPWSEEIGAGDAAYCISAATIIPHHNGVQWPGDVQFPPKGFAYCPYGVTWAVKHGLWEWDRSSSGSPAVVHEGDLLLWDWNFDGVADHCETAMADDRNPTQVANIIGYNMGKPEGCHHPVTRPRKYLLGVIHMCRFAYGGTPPKDPVPGGNGHGNPSCPLVVDGQFGPMCTKALQFVCGVSQDGGFGPDTKKALQTHLGVAADGDVGPDTIKALQTKLGVTPDGQWGAQTTTALQKALNAGTF